MSLSIWFNNVLRRYLERRGWVVFYLEEQQRVCNGHTCWLNLYEQERGAVPVPRYIPH